MEPVSRIEKYLNRMANGGSGDLPAPVSRIEHYLAQIAEGGGGGGGGGSSSALIVNEDNDTYTLDKTWQEIYDAVMSNRVCFIGSSSDAENWGDLYLLVNIQWSEGSYSVSNGNATYYADSPNDYPVSD